jgi:hypothetical protein
MVSCVRTLVRMQASAYKTTAFSRAVQDATRFATLVRVWIHHAKRERVQRTKCAFRRIASRITSVLPRVPEQRAERTNAAKKARV